MSGGRRRLAAAGSSEYAVPTRAPRFNSPRQARVLVIATLVVWVLSAVLCLGAIVDLPLPSGVLRPAAAVHLVVASVALTHRVGGRLRLWVPVAAVLAIGGAATQTGLGLATAAVATAVVAAVLAVVMTRPASTVVDVLREVAVSIVISVAGALAVAAWTPPVGPRRFALLVVIGALALSFLMIWRLGAGLHGLSRSNLGWLIGGAVAVVALITYFAVLRSYGSQVLLNGIEGSTTSLRAAIGGVPRPFEVLVGFPALVLGVSLRSLRRDGWWIVVFAVIGTATITASLVSTGAYPVYIALSTVYSALLGVPLGFVARHFLLGSRSGSGRAGARGGRARGGSRRQADQSVAAEQRVEPSRFSPLR